jgi:hypothetical protein
MKKAVNYILAFCESYRRPRFITKVIEYDGTEKFAGYAYGPRPWGRYAMTAAVLAMIYTLV